MTVAELIAFLQKQPGHMPVAFQLHSEQCLMDEKDISVKELCLPRPDGWVHDKRSDKPSIPYLLFPGN